MSKTEKRGDRSEITPELEAKVLQHLKQIEGSIYKYKKLFGADMVERVVALSQDDDVARLDAMSVFGEISMEEMKVYTGMLDEYSEFRKKLSQLADEFVFVLKEKLMEVLRRGMLNGQNPDEIYYNQIFGPKGIVSMFQDFIHVCFRREAGSVYLLRNDATHYVTVRVLQYLALDLKKTDWPICDDKILNYIVGGSFPSEEKKSKISAQFNETQSFNLGVLLGEQSFVVDGESRSNVIGLAPALYDYYSSTLGEFADDLPDIPENYKEIQEKVAEWSFTRRPNESKRTGKLPVAVHYDELHYESVGRWVAKPYLKGLTDDGANNYFTLDRTRPGLYVWEVNVSMGEVFGEPGRRLEALIYTDLYECLKDEPDDFEPTIELVDEEFVELGSVINDTREDLASEKSVPTAVSSPKVDAHSEATADEILDVLNEEVLVVERKKINWDILSEMTSSAMKKLLKKLKCKFVRCSGSHHMYVSPTGDRVPVPLGHAKVKRVMVVKCLKKLGFTPEMVLSVLR